MSSTHITRVARISRRDLFDDFDELHAIASTMLHQSRLALVGLAEAARFIASPGRAHIEENLGRLICNASNHRRHLHKLMQAVGDTGWPLEMLEREKASIAGSLRILHCLLGAASTAGNWASPSIEHSGPSFAGPRTHRIRAHHDDYTRDRHAEAARFERMWLRKYVDDPHGLEPTALMTSSGMAAFVTILHHIAGELGPGPVLVGRDVYHESAALLRSSALARRIIEVDERDRGQWENAIIRGRPAAIFLDSLCNESSLAMPDLAAILAATTRAGRPLYVVVDNSACSVTLQAWAMLQPTCPAKLIVFESVTKYAQFGFDLVPAGMIVASRSEAAGLDALREHLGTNVPEVAVNQIPAPDRARLRRRLARIARNCDLLARALRERAESGDLSVEVTHPSFPDHPGRRLAVQRGFTGGYAALDFSSHVQARRFVDLVLIEAQRHGMPLTEGTSFGLNVTRVYLTGDDPEAHPFVRIAAGTEHLGRAHQVAALLADVLQSTLAAPVRDPLLVSGF